MRKKVFMVLMALIFCSPKNVKKIESADVLYEEGKKYFESGYYKKASEKFDRLILNYPGSPLFPSAQYYLAYSFYWLKDYERASTEFEFLYKQFPASAFAEEAELMSAVCVYKLSPPYYKDQTKSKEAKRKLENFIKKHPESKLREKAEDYIKKINEKLAKKELEAAKMYFKFQEYNSAVQYLEFILEIYPNTLIAEDAKFYLARCYLEMGKEEDAKKLLEELKNSQKYSKEANKLLGGKQ